MKQEKNKKRGGAKITLHSSLHDKQLKLLLFEAVQCFFSSSISGVYSQNFIPVFLGFG